MLIRDDINISNWRPYETVRPERRVHGSVRACVCVCACGCSSHFLISVAKDRSRRRRGLGRVTIRSVILTRTPSPDALLPHHLVSVPMYAQLRYRRRRSSTPVRIPAYRCVHMRPITDSYPRAYSSIVIECWIQLQWNLKITAVESQHRCIFVVEMGNVGICL